MLEFLGKRTLISRLLVWAAGAALLLGFAGSLQKSIVISGWPASAGDMFKVVLDSAVEAFRVFVPRLEGPAGSDGWITTLGRFLGALAACAATIALLGRVLREDFSRMKLSWISRHTIIIGYDDLARAFAHRIRSEDRQAVVIIDVASGAATRDQVLAAGCHYVGTDVEGLAKALKVARWRTSRDIIISTGSDEQNLALLGAIAKLEANAKPANTFAVTICLENGRLAEAMERDEIFIGRLGGNGRLRVFSRAREAAMALLDRTSFVDLALDRKQDRVHLVIVGDSDIAVETIIQFLRVSPAIGLKRPHIDWIVDDRKRLLQRLHGRNEPLFESVTSGNGSANGPLKWAAEINVVVPKTETLLPGRAEIAGIEARDGAVTAVVIAGLNESANPALALQLRTRCARQGVWQAPFFVLSPDPTALDVFFRRLPDAGRATPRPLGAIPAADAVASVLEPFGRTSELCSFEVGQERDRLARKVHGAYLAQRRKDAKNSSADADESARNWQDLAESYRVASRRSAAHIPVKLRSSGASAPDGEEGSDLAQILSRDPEMMEALAEIEHDAWWIDRELDGWRLADKRDNNLKLHPSLKPYAELTDDVKEYDRVQIRLLAQI